MAKKDSSQKAAMRGNKEIDDSRNGHSSFYHLKLLRRKLSAY